MNLEDSEKTKNLPSAGLSIVWRPAMFEKFSLFKGPDSPVDVLFLKPEFSTSLPSVLS